MKQEGEFSAINYVFTFSPKKLVWTQNDKMLLGGKLFVNKLKNSYLVFQIKLILPIPVLKFLIIVNTTMNVE